MSRLSAKVYNRILNNKKCNLHKRSLMMDDKYDIILGKIIWIYDRRVHARDRIYPETV
jgi:hypothetical protein